MKPRFLIEMEEAFAVKRHVILSLNTEDRFFYSELNIGPANLNYFLAAYFSRMGFRIAQYSATTGLRELSLSSESLTSIRQLNQQNVDPIEVLNGIRGLLSQQNERWIILFLHAEKLAPARESGMTSSQNGEDFGEVLHTLAMDDGIAQGQSRIVLVTYTGLPEALLVRSRGFRQIDVGLPSQEERREFISFLENISEEGCPDFGRLEPGFSEEEMSRVTSGMALSGIESAYRASAFRNKFLSREDVRMAKSRDIRNLARDLLQVSEPEFGFESVAGLKHVKAYFQDLIPSITSGSPGVHQAFLFQGVPGCGKSHLVNALAKEMGWPLLEMRNVRSPYVGQSEQNLEHVIRVIEQLQPAIVFFDEIDQMLGQRSTGGSGDSGTSERILARIFSWLGSLHLRGQVVFIGATNRPDILDAALLDRFGVSIPFLKPAKEEIREIIPMLMSKFERDMSSIDMDEVTTLFSNLNLTARDIQEIIISAGIRADREKRQVGAPIEISHLKFAAQDHLPREDKLEMRYLTLVSISLCSQNSLLPWNDQRGIRSGTQIPEFLTQENIVDEIGRLNQERLSEVLRQLKEHRYKERNMR